MSRVVTRDERYDNVQCIILNRYRNITISTSTSNNIVSCHCFKPLTVVGCVMYRLQTTYTAGWLTLRWFPSFVAFPSLHRVRSTHISTVAVCRARWALPAAAALPGKWYNYYTCTIVQYTHCIFVNCNCIPITNTAAAVIDRGISHFTSHCIILRKVAVTKFSSIFRKALILYKL